MAGKLGRPRKNPVAEPVPASEQREILENAGRSVVETQVRKTGEFHDYERAQREPTPELEPHPSDVAPAREASHQARSGMREGTGRKKRTPLGVPVQRLQAEVPDGMTGRWNNDTPGRLQRALQGGYEFISGDKEVVQDRKGGRSEIVGTGRDGGAMTGHLMAIPTVLYEEDQRAKAALNKERMTAIKRGEPSQAAEQDKGSFYTPSEGITLRDEVR